MPDVLTTLQKLPPLCFTTMPGRPGQVIAIKRGERGCYPIQTACTPAELNRTLDPEPSAKQIECMLVGSMFGWEVPGADPDRAR